MQKFAEIKELTSNLWDVANDHCITQIGEPLNEDVVYDDTGKILSGKPLSVEEQLTQVIDYLEGTS